MHDIYMVFNKTNKTKTVVFDYPNSKIGLHIHTVRYICSRNNKYSRSTTARCQCTDNVVMWQEYNSAHSSDLDENNSLLTQICVLLEQREDNIAKVFENLILANLSTVLLTSEGCQVRMDMTRCHDGHLLKTLIYAKYFFIIVIMIYPSHLRKCNLISTKTGHQYLELLSTTSDFKQDASQAVE